MFKTDLQFLLYKKNIKIMLFLTGLCPRTVFGSILGRDKSGSFKTLLLIGISHVYVGETLLWLLLRVGE